MATGGIALNGSSQYLQLNSRVVSAFPFTLVCWVAQNASGSSQFVIAQQQSNGDRYAAAWFDANGTTKYGNLRNPGNSDNATKTTSPNPSASLQLMVAVFTSTTSRTIYFGNNTGATSTTTMLDDISNHDRLTIGAWNYNSGGPGLYLNGVVAEAHIFNTALSASDVNTLLTTKPEDVAGWVDGWTLANASSLTSIGGTRTLTAVGSPTTGTVTLPYTRTTAATAVTMTGPSSGTVGSPSSNFTIGANGTITGTVTVTPSSGGGGGTFSPTSVAISSGTPTATFTYTAASSGAKTISVTNSGGLTNPSNITYTASDPAATSMTIVLKQSDGTTPAASITGIEVALMNASTLGAATALLDTWTGESTDASGNLVLDITGLGLTVGQVRYVVAGKSNGTVGSNFDGWHGPATAA